MVVNSPIKRRPRTTHGRTNRISVDEVAKNAKKDRRRETATWNKALAPDARDWSTESMRASAFSKSAVLAEEDWMIKQRELREKSIQMYNKRLFIVARDKLNQIACHRFGSLEAMFKQNTKETITLEEFSTYLKRQKLDSIFPRDHQRIIFETLDHGCTEQLRVDDLLHFLSLDKKELMNRRIVSSLPLPEDGGLKRLQDEEDDEAKTQNLDGAVIKAPLLPRHLLETKDELVDSIYRKTRQEKVKEAVVNQRQYMLNLFKQCDLEMSGFLTCEQMVDALGEKHVDLGIPRERLIALVDGVDAIVNTDASKGMINYRKFIRFLEFTDIEPDYNPFFDSRDRVLLHLKRISGTEIASEYQPNPIHESQTKIHLPESETPEAPQSSVDSQKKGRIDLQNQRIKPLVAPCLHSTEMKRFNDTILRRAQTAVKPAARPVTSSSALFDDMRKTKEAQLSSICPRFVPPPKTDWKRTGLGGDGIDQNSGLYLPPSERFRTASARYYGPLKYNQARSLVRDIPSDAEHEASRREQRLKARRAQTARNQQQITHRLEQYQELAQLNDMQRIKAKATDMFGYLRNAYEKDLNFVRKTAPSSMQRRPNTHRYTRMWGGSNNNMLHPSNRAEFSEHILSSVDGSPAPDVWATTQQIAFPPRKDLYAPREQQLLGISVNGAPSIGGLFA